MGKPGGFLEFSRKDPGYRDPRERVRDFDPVALRLMDAEIGIQAARCMDCGTPFCHAHGCPVGNLIPELNDLVYHRRWREAAELLLSTNNFPEFTARVCPAPCEASCVLSINDEPVTIRQIEMAIIEKAYEKGYIRPRPPSARLNRRAAVIGSGPAGLAVADSLNRAGCSVTVFDRERHAGGILRYGIPDFKLEKAVLDRRLKLMEAEGVVFELGVTVGDDISYKFLKDRFDAICLTGGSREPRDLSIPGRDLAGIHFAIEYLVRQNRILAGEPVAQESPLDARDKRVAIVGGGDTGADCLGTALRQGAREVLQIEILPRPPEERPPENPWPMWPNVLRETSSHQEGGHRRWSIRAKEFLGSDGHVRGMRCVEVDWARGRDPRAEPPEKEGTEFEAPAQLVLLAMGFVGPGRNRIVSDLHIELDARGNIKVDAHHMTSSRGIFAAGDMARGQSLVVRAIADGRETAKGIMEYLRTL